MPLSDALSPEQDITDTITPDATQYDDTLTPDPEVDSALKDYMQPADVPTPSPKGAKFLKYNDDGSALFDSGGQKIKYFRGDGHIEWEQGDKTYSSKSPLLKPVVIKTNKPSPDELMRDTAARKGVVPSKYPLGEKDPEYIKAAQQALNPNALGGDAASGSTGEESLAGLNDADKATVKLMAEYKWPIPPGGIRNPKQLALLQRASQYDQTFAPSEYTIRQKTRMDYSSGKSFQNARSLNTLAGHLDNLSNHADKLNNGPNRQWNAATNYVESTLMGRPEMKLFETDVNAVTNELGQLLRGGAVTDQDVKRWQAAISSSDSPSQLKATIKEFADLARSRLDALQQGYEGVMRKPADIQIMSPKAKASFKKLGVLSEEDIANTPGGAQGFGAQPSATPEAALPPRSKKAKYPIGTRAKDGGAWRTMTEHGWEPPL